MEDSLAMSIVLALLFFGVSLAYSSVGLGGGSAYTALMAIFGLSHVMIPTTSLTLNLLVTFIGSVNTMPCKIGSPSPIPWPTGLVANMVRRTTSGALQFFRYGFKIFLERC